MAKEPSVLITGGEIAELLDPVLLETHIRNKVISRRSHPTLPLAILNYTNLAQFGNIWDSVTKRCRGLIYNIETGDLVAVPFAKFFNYDTSWLEETFPENLPAREPEITRKLDGSLGIYWRYEGQWGIATRGSFTSDQAKWATKWARENASLLGTAVPEGTTLLFEIIYPENQIVVKYDYSGLVLIGGVDIETGHEFGYAALKLLGKTLGIPVVERVDGNIEELTLMDAENEEGYVATWHNEEGPPLRVKIKFETYFRLHRLLTGTSPKRIWEYLKDGVPLTELLEDVPAHFREWGEAWIIKLTDSYNDIREAAIQRFGQIKQLPTRKDFALWATQPENKRYASVLFKMLDGQRYDVIIWKMIKPAIEGLGTFKTVDE